MSGSASIYMSATVCLNCQSLFVLKLRREWIIPSLHNDCFASVFVIPLRQLHTFKSVEHRSISFQQYIVYFQALLYITVGTILIFCCKSYERGIIGNAWLNAYITRGQTPYCAVGEAAQVSDARAYEKLSFFVVCRSAHKKPISPIVSSRLMYRQNALYIQSFA